MSRIRTPKPGDRDYAEHRAQIRRRRLLKKVDFSNIEHEDGYLILYRDRDGGPTDPCPFCGEIHHPGLGDGHCAGVCQGRFYEDLTVTAKDGTILYASKGYIVRTRIHPSE